MNSVDTLDGVYGSIFPSWTLVFNTSSGILDLDVAERWDLWEEEAQGCCGGGSGSRCFFRHEKHASSYMTLRKGMVRPNTIQMAKPGVTPNMYPTMLDLALPGPRSGSVALASRATSSRCGRWVTRLASMNALDTSVRPFLRRSDRDMDAPTRLI